MISAEMLANKIQEVLGPQYLIKVNGAFNQEFVKPLQTQFGVTYDIDYQAFKKYSDVIVGVVSTLPTSLTDTAFTLILDAYTVDFWVPVDFIKFDKYKDVLETPKFNFYADMERLKNAVRNTKLNFESEGESLSGFMTMSEPVLASQLENTGACKRVNMRIQGNLTVADQSVGSGDEIRIGFVIDGTESDVNDFTNFALGSNTDGNSLIDQSNPKQLQDVAILTQVLSFTINDRITTEAERLIQDKAWRNLKILNNNQNTELQQKVMVRLYKGGEMMIEFWGLLSAQYTVAGRSSFGTYSVQIANGEDDGNI